MMATQPLRAIVWRVGGDGDKEVDEAIFKWLRVYVTNESVYSSLTYLSSSCVGYPPCRKNMLSETWM